MRAIIVAAILGTMGAGIVYTAPPMSNPMEGPLIVDGGVQAHSVSADAGSFQSVTADAYNGGTATLTGLTVNGAATLGPGVTLLAPLTLPPNASVSADAGTFGTLTTGAATLGPTVNVTGPLTVTGAASFSAPPTGIVRTGVLTRGAALGLSIGCASMGTVAVAGVTTSSACAVTYRPAAVTLGAVLDCYVTAPGTVTVRACALVALISAPAGDYGVTLVGE